MQVPAHASCGGWLYGRTVTQGVAQGARHRGRERCVAGVVAHGGDALAHDLFVLLEFVGCIFQSFAPQSQRRAATKAPKFSKWSHKSQENPRRSRLSSSTLIAPFQLKMES